MNSSDDLGSLLADLASRADSSQPRDRLEGIHRRARRTARTRAAAATLAAVLVGGSAAALIARSHDAASPTGPATHSTAHTPSERPTATSSRAALVPADAHGPAAGTCLRMLGALATIDMNPDTPSPRCIVVRADQRLRVVNTTNIAGSTGIPITVTFADYAPRVIQVGQATTFERPLGAYLAVGVHFVHVSPLYGGSSAELLLN